ncbi:MAG: hypothetical protein QOJ24_4320, partial [Mycobacterium sp.]|nr:hypothetical protein [Mycobacterium sp.]
MSVVPDLVPSVATATLILPMLAVTGRMRSP